MSRTGVEVEHWHRPVFSSHIMPGCDIEEHFGPAQGAMHAQVKDVALYTPFLEHSGEKLSRHVAGAPRAPARRRGRRNAG